MTKQQRAILAGVAVTLVFVLGFFAGRLSAPKPQQAPTMKYRQTVERPHVAVGYSVFSNLMAAEEAANRVTEEFAAILDASIELEEAGDRGAVEELETALAAFIISRSGRTPPPRQ